MYILGMIKFILIQSLLLMILKIFNMFFLNEKFLFNVEQGRGELLVLSFFHGGREKSVQRSCFGWSSIAKLYR